jgi:hypothetical protein
MDALDVDGAVEFDHAATCGRGHLEAVSLVHGHRNV